MQSEKVERKDNKKRCLLSTSTLNIPFSKANFQCQASGIIFLSLDSINHGNGENKPFNDIKERSHVSKGLKDHENTRFTAEGG